MSDGPHAAGFALGPGTDLGGSARSRVHRHEVLDGPTDWGETVVVKRFVPQPAGSRAAMGYGRELTGLRHLAGTPRLLTSDDATQTVVMEDLGEHPTLADVLLDDDPDLADRQMIAWAEALGRAVVADPEVLAAAHRDLGDAMSEDRRVRCEFPRVGLAHLQEVTGSRHAAAAVSEALDAVDWLESDTARHVLGPGDVCPDNAVLRPGQVRFIDLEGTGIRHAAYEAAYAAEPFSTCWCVFTTPWGLTDRMLAAFTQGVSAQLPGLAHDLSWRRQVRLAVALWVLSGTLWLLDGALEDRVMTAGDRKGPTFRGLLVHRWRWVVRECEVELPGVARACDEAVTWALRTWGGEGASLVLPDYPAWRDRTGPS